MVGLNPRVVNITIFHSNSFILLEKFWIILKNPFFKRVLMPPEAFYSFKAKMP